MFSSRATQPEPVRPIPMHHERHISNHLSYTASHRPELPRPLEPRPTPPQQPLFNDPPASSRPPESYRSTAPAPAEYRPQSQNLPRIHDILTSAPTASSPSGYPSAWNNTPGHPPSQNGDGYYGLASRHPQSSHPPQAQSSYQSQPVRRLELPILETSPVARHNSRSGPPSPYNRMPDSGRDFAGHPHERGQQSSSSSYFTNGAPSPYTTTGTDDPHFRGPATSGDRPGSSSYGPAGPDSSAGKYLGIREVPGEGQFHLYEGGYRIPTQVDGETVNPAWGLTKANKPRKRLAMACLDCREKKIKCEPGVNSCLQCEKAKRQCRKAPAHQSQGDASTGQMWQSSAGSPTLSSVPDSAPTRPHETSDYDAAHKRRTMEDHSTPGAPAKKHRSASPAYTINSGGAPPVAIANHLTSPIQARSPERALCWEEDPYAVNPEITSHLLNHYFQDVNDATYCLFPRHHFMHWLRTRPQKCQNERVVLYAMLAVGSIFAEDTYSAIGKQCASIVTDALQSRQGRFGMCIIQARLLLGLYNFARGANELGWDQIGSGINAATYLAYQTEQGCAKEDSERTREFGFTNEQLIECKRRTLWSAFLMDRYCGGKSTVINPKDVYLRLPSLDDSFERGWKSEAPFYNNNIVDPANTALTASSPISPMAWLILAAAIWGDVVNFIYRGVYRSPLMYEEEYEKFYEQTHTALQGWSSRLPEQLQFSPANIERSIKGGYAGPYVSMHILYHLSCVKMNRFVRHSLISKSIARNIRATHRHSHELLRIISALRATKWDMAEKGGHIAPFSLTTPFAGYAILAAIDVVGAGGLDSNLKGTLDLICCGLECLRELARCWNSARDQHKACEKRYYQIQNVLKHPFTARSGCWLGREWGVHSSLEQEFAQEDDCIYGSNDRAYFDALKDDVPNGGSRMA